MRVLEEGHFGLALVVVNPLVVAQLRRRVGDATVVEVEAGLVPQVELQQRSF